MSGTLEAIALQLKALNLNLTELNKNYSSADTAVPIPEVPSTSDTDEDTDNAVEEKKPATRKPAAKKTAAKKTASKRKPKADDLSDMTLFKKRFFAIADSSGVGDVMDKLKKFIKDSGYANSDEIEVEDREAFLEKVQEHFEALAAADNQDDDEEYDLNEL